MLIEFVNTIMDGVTQKDLCKKGKGLNISESNYSSKTKQSRKWELIFKDWHFLNFF